MAADYRRSCRPYGGTVPLPDAGTKSSQSEDQGGLTEKSLLRVVQNREHFCVQASAKSAGASAIIYSISETAKLNDLRPYFYFRHLLTELPKYCDDEENIDPAELDGLLPWSEKLPDECRKPHH